VLTSHCAQIEGVDIFPVQLPDQPDNLRLLLSNLNESLRRGGFSLNHYDLIHSRCVSPGIKKERWRRYVAELAALLRRDGWVQFVEYYYIIQSDSGRLTDQHALQQWGLVYRAAMERERDPRVGRNLRGLLRDANLRDIQERTYNVPIGGWSSGKCEKSLAAYS